MRSTTTMGARNARRHLGSRHVWLAALTIVLLASCERTPSKSDYVSARVTEFCPAETTEDLQACRLAVINQFANVPLEELQRRYPPPKLRPRPSCAL